ncbi:MAG: nucleotidyltransferase domain-containing protein [Ignavibacteriae bacterium]|nr:nucleotidyltransferase domain-containing protein [Ignavibacteriota bacterium]
MELSPVISLSLSEKDKIIQILVDALHHRPEIVFSYIYGSFVELEQFRDVDVAIYYDEATAKQLDTLGYESKLSRELEKLIKLPVDVRVINNAPMGFQYSVTCGKVLTSRDEEFRCSFVERVWGMYLDYEPSVKEFIRDMFP